MSFTHLQVRSGYSLFNSTIRIDKLVEKASELHFKSLALTDDQVLYGAISFYQACVWKGIKPIIGMIVHVANKDINNDTCILLAKNNQGYRQLVQLSTYLQTNHLASIQKNDLKAYTEDLIGIFPITNHAIATLLQSDKHHKIYEYIQLWQQDFGDNDFYLGIQDHGLENEKCLNSALKQFLASYPMPVQVAAINDVCYLDAADDFAYDCLRAMKSGKEWPLKITDTSIKQHHLRSQEEMANIFTTWPEALETTERIAEKCCVTFDFEKKMLPSYPVPEDKSAHAYLEKLCWENVAKKYDEVTDEVSNRLAYELDVIQSMQFSDYFLIVADFVAFAKQNNIMVGPGRGSAAGSMVAYVLGITDVDPLKYQLLFERFLNPERITMPDIDIDFSDHRRDEVIEYVRNKYGSDHVAQIITLGTFAARSLIRELIKTIGVDKQDAYYLLKEMPVHSHKLIVDYVRESDKLKQYIKQSEKLKVLFKVATVLEGLPRHVSTHAAGVVISEKPLTDLVPLTVGANETALTQYTMNDLEAIGLLKMDFLGLRNLTLLERIIQTILFTNKKSVRLNKLPNDDVTTYQLLQKGLTNGIFQLESQGMKQVLKQLKPTSFEDIVAVNALYRPGPMEYIPTYIARKHKQEPVVYPHPDLAPILGETYGVLVYQEQIMQIAHKIAGFSLGEADILRRAVSKKKQAVMDEQKDAFIKGCLSNGYSQSIAEEIFDWIVKFSNYGFNRSHAVAYSMIAYQLAYLKAHYPVCFFTELLSSVANQQEKVNVYMKEAKEWNISIMPPSINHSFGKFSVENNQIRMGLSAIKGIGNQVVKEIIQARKQGPFKNLFDFCLRVSLKTVNRQSLELLIMAGAFDETYSNRASLLASIDKAIEQGELFHEFSDDQVSFFHNTIELEASYVEMEDFSVMKKLAAEKELLGIYISSHPLKNYRLALSDNGYTSIKRANNFVNRRNIRIAAIVQSAKVIRTKRGDSMAFITLGDETGDMEGVVFPDVFRGIRHLLHEEKTLIVTGKVELRNDRIQLIVADARPFNEVKSALKQKERLFLKISEQYSEENFKKIKNIANAFPGNTPIIIYAYDTKKTYRLSSDYSVNPIHDCLRAFKTYFGDENVVLEKRQHE